jgi:hypothetical protein
VTIAVPADTPVTIPVKEPTVAIPPEPELHIPGANASYRLVVVPEHMLEAPVNTGVEGTGLTVKIVVDMDTPQAKVAE